MRGFLVLLVLCGCGQRSVFVDAGLPDAGADGSADGGSDGGCVPTTCAGLGLDCGNIGDGCGGTADGPQGCGACSAPATCVNNRCGAPGADAGDGTGLFVTLKYDRKQSADATGCNQGTAKQACSVVVQMSQTYFDGIRAEYASCALSQPTADSYLLDCSGDCATGLLARPAGCSLALASYYSQLSCALPAATSALTCQWTP